MQIVLSEPVVVPDVFSCGLAEPEDLGDGFYRLTYYVKQRCPQTGATDLVIVARIILPYGAILSARMEMSRLFGCYCGKDRKLFLAH